MEVTADFGRAVAGAAGAVLSEAVRLAVADAVDVAVRGGAVQHGDPVHVRASNALNALAMLGLERACPPVPDAALARLLLAQSSDRGRRSRAVPFWEELEMARVGLDHQRAELVMGGGGGWERAEEAGEESKGETAEAEAVVVEVADAGEAGARPPGPEYERGLAVAAACVRAERASARRFVTAAVMDGEGAMCRRRRCWVGWRRQRRTRREQGHRWVERRPALLLLLAHPPAQPGALGGRGGGRGARDGGARRARAARAAGASEAEAGAGGVHLRLQLRGR